MPKSVDANQPEIVAALRAVGATVQHLHEVGRGCPDILVGFRQRNYLLEIKNCLRDWKLTPAEEIWLVQWRGQACVVETADEALRAVGAVR